MSPLTVVRASRLLGGRARVSSRPRALFTRPRCARGCILARCVARTHPIQASCAHAQAWIGRSSLLAFEAPPRARSGTRENRARALNSARATSRERSVVTVSGTDREYFDPHRRSRLAPQRRSPRTPILRDAGRGGRGVEEPRRRVREPHHRSSSSKPPDQLRRTKCGHGSRVVVGQVAPPAQPSWAAIHDGMEIRTEALVTAGVATDD